MTRPQFEENLRLLFPELESIPHHDTLNRLLCGIDVDKIEEIHIGLIRQWIRNKKFYRYLVGNCYPVAIDGTQKHVRGDLLGKEWPERRTGKENAEGEREEQYYVYVLEAKLVFRNGMVLPLMSEFLNYEKGDTDADKQDCETRAFHRLAARMKREFPRLPIMVLLDGLYPNGPIFERCREYNWDFMIVLQDKSLPSVWEEYDGLRELEADNRYLRTLANRKQSFRWVNDIDYRYGSNGRKKQTLHLVVCEEGWEEIGKAGEVETKQSRHAWLSSKPLTRGNVHERCNQGARHRWGIESGILVEKHHGYQYEHLFSHNWNGMRGFHYLMQLGHTFNILAHWSTVLRPFVAAVGYRGLVDFVRETLAAPWPRPAEMRRLLDAPFQLRLV